MAPNPIYIELPLVILGALTPHRDWESPLIEPKLENDLRRVLGRSNASAQPERLEPDVATVRRLDRLWTLCCARLMGAFDCWVARSATEEDASLSDGRALGRRFASAVLRAICRAYRLLFGLEAVPPDLPLSTWWEADPEHAFTNNALLWRVKARPEALVDQLRTDGHSPGRWRVLGPMSQMSAFAQAFGCKVGDAMVAGEPIVVW